MKRRGMAAVVTAAVAVGGFAAAQPGSPAGASSARKPVGCKSTGSRLIENGPRSKKAIAITFDDGPSTYTARMLRILATHKVRATFFPTANQIKGRAQLFRSLFAAGHEVQNHTFTHADLGSGGQLVTDELRRASAEIKRVIGFTPCIFRPTFDYAGGDIVPRARRLKLATVRGDVRPSDWETPGTDVIIQRVLSKTRNGSIIILHDGGGERDQTIAALPTILRTLKSRGFTFVTLTKLLGYQVVRAAG